ncbi:MAG: fold metallo-hydrolase, partial [Noviherbaspirillum sp.]|nr:fold metallo-hydrolase [Noviherbaspirillum sp.]
MNRLEAQLDYAFGDTVPAPGATYEVAHGVLWIRMGLPFALDHINLWLVLDEFDNGSGP